MYNRALAQERTVRDEAVKPTLAQMRRAVAAYEAVVRRFPASGYADNALWQAANLAALAFERFGNEADRKTSDSPVRARWPGVSLEQAGGADRRAARPSRADDRERRSPPPAGAATRC